MQYTYRGLWGLVVVWLFYSYIAQWQGQNVYEVNSVLWA